METQILADTLKKALKFKGINQEKLSELLGISERSVNRILTGGTLTTERLFEICKLMGITLSELLQMEDADYERKDMDLTKEQEEFFASNFEYGLFYSLLHTYDSVKKLAKDYNIDDQTIGKLLAQLEKLNLLKWLPGNEAQLFEPRKFNTPTGPIYQSKAKELGKALAEKSVTNSKNPGFLFFPNLSKNSQAKFRVKMEELFKEIKKDREIESLLKIETDVVGVFLCLEPFGHVYEELRDLRL